MWRNKAEQIPVLTGQLRPLPAPLSEPVQLQHAACCRKTRLRPKLVAAKICSLQKLLSTNPALYKTCLQNLLLQNLFFPLAAFRPMTYTAQLPFYRRVNPSVSPKFDNPSFFPLFHATLWCAKQSLGSTLLFPRRLGYIKCLGYDDQDWPARHGRPTRQQ